MAYIDQSLSNGENIAAKFKLHWFSWMYFILWIVIAPVTLGITLIFALYEFVRLKNIEQGVTTKRVIIKTGIVARKTQEMKLSSIETIDIDQSIIGRIFGFGTVRITGRGISDCVLKNIANPLHVKKTIENAFQA
ncbi:PH domain-containing protein [Pseudomonas sp. F1_0610]|uniref:PH domain-containing protein n=1 Tax=Pseudomonas sp. F1_0610 TaxID=3114284 RepID=UPI0039C2963A